MGGIIHSDLIGPMEPTTGGKKYMLSFIDKTWTAKIALIERKSDTTEVFKSFKINFELQDGAKILKIHSDQGGEYRSLAKHLQKEGIEVEYSAAFRP